MFSRTCVVDHAVAAREVAVLRGFADEFVHLRDAAFVDQVHDQLQLVQALEIGGLGLVAGFDQRFPSGLDQRARAAAEHGLLAEEIGLRLFLEGGLDHAGFRAADGVRVGKRAIKGVARGVLMHREQARHAAARFVLAPHQISRALRRHHGHVDISSAA